MTLKNKIKKGGPSRARRPDRVPGRIHPHFEMTTVLKKRTCSEIGNHNQKYGYEQLIGFKGINCGRYKKDTRTRTTGSQS